MEMNNESIKSILNWFPYPESSKIQLQLLLIEKDPKVMAALSNFIRTKDVNYLNQEFQKILSEKGLAQNETIVTQTYGQTIGQPLSTLTKINVITSNIPRSTTPTTSPKLEWKNRNDVVYTQELVEPPKKIIHIRQKSSPGLAQETQYIAGPQGFGAVLPPSMHQQMREQKLAEQNRVRLQEQNDRSVILSKLDSSVKLPSDSVRLTQSLIAGRPKPPAVTIEMMMNEYVPGKGFTQSIKDRFREQSRSLSFTDFLEFRHNLKLDEIPLKEFVQNIKSRSQALYPQKPGISTPPLTVERFIQLMGGFDLPPETIYHLILSFYYMDFNDNGLLDMDEIIHGFILMGKGTEAEKIECAFMMCDKDGNNLLDINELEFYLHAVIRMSRGKSLEGLSAVKRYEAEKEIANVARALTHKVFEEIDSDKNGKISLEEFRIWHNLFRKQPVGRSAGKTRGDLVGIVKQAKSMKDNKLISTQLKQDPKKFETFQKQKIVSQNGHVSAINHIRSKQQDLNLESVTMAHVNKILKTMKTSERLNKNDFQEFLVSVMKEANLPKAKQAQLASFSSKIFRLLDSDGNGVLDWNELLGGLSLLIGGSQKDKVQTLFRVFDKNGDEILTFKELFFLLKSSYTVLLYKNPMEELKKQSAEELAFAAANKCFAEIGVPLTGGINFVQFQNWYGA